MIRTIARYGARHVPGSMLAGLKAVILGEGLRGPFIEEFEKRFAAYHGMQHAICASYGRMAFYYILKALLYQLIFTASPAIWIPSWPQRARMGCS